MTNPLAFAENFLKQPFPTMGLAPSAAPTRTGGTVVQQGGLRIGETGTTMWARIASAVPFGWTLGGIVNASKAISPAADAVKAKLSEGAQAVEGKVKSASSSIGGFFSSFGSTLKWAVIIGVAVIVIFFLAQVKSLFRN